MAITIHQTPRNVYSNSLDVAVQGTIQPIYYTYSTDLNGNYWDMYYRIFLETDRNFELNPYKSVPTSTQKFSKISLTKGIDELLEYEYNPTISEIVNNKNDIICTKAKIKTVTLNTELETQETKIVFYKKSYLNHGFEQKNFLLTDESEYLVHQKKKILPLTAFATGKAFFGKFTTNPFRYHSQFNKIVYEFKLIDGTIINAEVHNNLNYTTVVDEYQIVHTNDMIAEFPIGPANFNNQSIYVSNIVLPNGFVFYVNDFTTLNLNNLESYKYRFMQDDDVRSIWYYVQIENCRTRYTPTTLTFINDLGGFEHFTFYANTEEVTNIKTKYYKKSNFELVSNKYRVNNQYHGGNRVYDADVKYILELNSDWLSKEEIDIVNQIRFSPNIYVQIDNDIYSGIILDSKIGKINKKNPSLKRIKLTVQINKDKIIY